MSGEPYSKARQLARGKRRYRRHVASAKGWQRIQNEKLGPCRICRDPGRNGSLFGKIALHHVVPRDLGGDDYAANIVPLCFDCHTAVTALRPKACRALLGKLTKDERAYAVDRLGDNWQRVYGIKP